MGIFFMGIIGKNLSKKPLVLPIFPVSEIFFKKNLSGKTPLATVKLLYNYMIIDDFFTFFILARKLRIAIGMPNQKNLLKKTNFFSLLSFCFLRRGKKATAIV